MSRSEPIAKFRVIGTKPVRTDGYDKVTGRARFADDVHLPGMLHGKVLRSPHAHAVIKSIDTSKAESLPGVEAIVIGAEFPELQDAIVNMGEAGTVDMNNVAESLIAKSKVFYDGHAIAAVAAKNPHVAEEAVALIEVEYETLEPVMDVQSAMAEGAPVLHEKFTPGAFFIPTEQVRPNAGKLQLGAGDIEQGFAEADLIIEREFTSATVHQGYIEPHFTTVQWGGDGNITVWTSTQSQFAMRDQLAIILDVPQHKINVIPLEIGGGFGGKDQVFADPLAAMLSKKTGGKPVKIAMSRSEVLRATGPSPGTHMKIKLGAKADGSFVAADLYYAYEAGCFPGGPVAPGVLSSTTRYNLPNIRIEGFDVVVNKPKMRPYRAPGVTPSNYAFESVIDELAEKLGMDKVDLRIKNAMKTGDLLFLGFPSPPIGSVEILEAVKNHPHYTAPLEGKNRGRGMAYGFWFGAGLVSSAELMVNADGTVQLNTGSCDLSGTRMTLAMQAAETLGIDAEDVFPSIGDTNSVGYTFPSVGSRTTFATGIAVYDAAKKVLDQMAERAALIWEIDTGDVEIGVGIFSDKTADDRKLTFKELAGKLDATGGPISAQATAAPEGAGFQLAAHLVDVEVDTETGKVSILRYTAFQDAGKAIHPDYVEGQIQGGVVQGIGWALNEELFYNAEGKLVNASLLDYRMPTTLDLPMIDPVILETPNPGHPYGVRGVGEVPIVPPVGAIANAIHDAIGIRMDVLPMSPGNILKKIWERDSQGK